MSSNDLSVDQLIAVLNADLAAMLEDARLDMNALWDDILLNDQEAAEAIKKDKKGKPSSKKGPYSIRS